jgi:N6-L-threonylcarbamoyladenine synthase
MTMRSQLTSELVLAVETSCDDTTAAVVSGGRRVLSSHVASQEEIHALFGGVVPEVASRKHVEAITHVVQDALDEAGATWGDLGGLAVTNGPGLIGSLLVGVSAMKAYHLATGLPLVGVNHLDGHVNSNFCDLPGGAQVPALQNGGGAQVPALQNGGGAQVPALQNGGGAQVPAVQNGGGAQVPALQNGGGAQVPAHQGAPEDFPALCLIASGGHSDLVLMRSRTDYELLGCTRDDAAGEALDKAARVLELGYPGGPAMQRAAAEGQARFELPRPIIEGSLDYSFAGLKTALLRLVAELKGQGELPVNDLAASYQEAVVDTLVRNVRKAAAATAVRQILLCGGVAANTLLRERLAQLGEELGLPVRYPPLKLCTDNAAMVGAAGWLKLVAGEHDNLALDVFSAQP